MEALQASEAYHSAQSRHTARSTRSAPHSAMHAASLLMHLVHVSTVLYTVQASFDESLHEMVYGDGPGLPEPEAFDVASLGELFAEPEPEPER